MKSCDQLKPAVKPCCWILTLLSEAHRGSMSESWWGSYSNTTCDAVCIDHRAQSGASTHRLTATEGSRHGTWSSLPGRPRAGRLSHWLTRTGRCHASGWCQRGRRCRSSWHHLRWPGGCWRCQLERGCTASQRSEPAEPGQKVKYN